ncbi:MAG: hypothetical protein GY918_07095, partial [Gammaproteobacteria bacterium]|nr:hypothetical protein [Gammaproteobacteria bacterium]
MEPKFQANGENFWLHHTAKRFDGTPSFVLDDTKIQVQVFYINVEATGSLVNLNGHKVQFLHCEMEFESSFDLTANKITPASINREDVSLVWDNPAPIVRHGAKVETASDSTWSRPESWVTHAGLADGLLSAGVWDSADSYVIAGGEWSSASCGDLPDVTAVLYKM